MRQAILAIALLSSAFFLAGCGKGAVDTSSMEAFKKSVEETAKGLDEATAAKFQDSVQAIMLKKVIWSSQLKDEASMTKMVKELFDGKSVKEIIAMGDQVKAETQKEIDNMMKN